MGQLNTSKELEIKVKIQKIVREYFNIKHKDKNYPFIPGYTAIPAMGTVYDEEELMMLVESCLDYNQSDGKFKKQFEMNFLKITNLKHLILVNSFPTAILLALSALFSPVLNKRSIKSGDEVITSATTPPKTVEILVNKGIIPVFADIKIGSYNIDISHLNRALSRKTKAVIVSHSMGIPAEIEAISKFCQKNGLWLIEDCSKALGVYINGYHAGNFSDISLFSFCNKDHISMIQGGAVATNIELLKEIMLINYEYQTNDDFNIDLPDINAAIGVAQLRKLQYFINTRKRNFEIIHQNLKNYQEYIVLPEKNPYSNFNPICFPIFIQNNSFLSRNKLLNYLNNYKIGTEYLNDNVTKHPKFLKMKYKKAINLKNSNYISSNSFCIGVYPGLTEEMVDYSSSKIIEYIRNIKQ